MRRGNIWRSWSSITTRCAFFSRPLAGSCGAWPCELQSVQTLVWTSCSCVFFVTGRGQGLRELNGCTLRLQNLVTRIVASVTDAHCRSVLRNLTRVWEEADGRSSGFDKHQVRALNENLPWDGSNRVRKNHEYVIHDIWWSLQ